MSKTLQALDVSKLKTLEEDLRARAVQIGGIAEEMIARRQKVMLVANSTDVGMAFSHLDAFISSTKAAVQADPR